MRRFLVGCIGLYRVIATPCKIVLGLGGSCRFQPTCSHYCQEAILLHGCCRGTLLGAGRILRCHPWGGWGDDPVPHPNARN